jgi:hypothetical protein
LKQADPPDFSRQLPIVRPSKIWLAVREAAPGH